MKRNIRLILATVCVALGWLACSDESYPENPTLVAAISGMTVEVNGTDYIVTPQLLKNGTLSNTYLLTVKAPSATALVKQLDLADPSASVSIKAGDVITFTENRFSFEWKKDTQVEELSIEMSFPPEVMYLVRSKEGYALDKTTAQTIVSLANNGLFEGYVDLTDANWDNIGLVQGDGSVYFDVSGGLNRETYGSFTMVAKPSPETGSYPSDGPWADWSNVNNKNEETMFCSGVWKINFNADTKVMILLETQWAVAGTAVSGTKNMSYNSATRKWSLTTELSAGKLKFTTVPMTAGDPVVTYGTSDGVSKLSETGTDIVISEGGTYQIELDLSTPYYNYTITK